MEAIEVTVKFDQSGNIKPLSFIRKGISHPVDSIGRQWEDNTGRHYLVMVPIERIFELLFVPTELRWYIRKEGPDRIMA